MAIPFPDGFYPKAEFTMELGTRLKRVGFGDGYEQISPDGLNPKMMKSDLAFTELTNDRKNQLVNWYDSLNGQYVAYQIPDDIKPRIWSVTKFSIRRLSFYFWEISIGFDLKSTPETSVYGVLNFAQPQNSQYIPQL
jgi:phage-related protein